MTTFNLSKEGYVLNFLTTEAVISDFVAPHTDKNQLKFEADMRHLYNKPCTETPGWGELGGISDLGAPWKFYAQNRNPYIDFSIFYFTLTDVKIHGVTQLVSEKAQKVRARIWSYARVNLWVNGTHAATIDEPVYKPISHTDFEIDLREGVNDVFVSIENFGVRDTRNMFALQLKDTDGISVALPGNQEDIAKLKEAEDWLCSVTSDGKKLVADANPPADVEIVYFPGREKDIWTGGCEFDISGKKRFDIAFEVCGQKFFRSIQLLQNLEIEFEKEETSPEERMKECIAGIGELADMNHYSSIYVLAHHATTGVIDHRDYERIDVVLDKVKTRIDCSDFGLAALFVAYEKLPLKEEYKQKIRERALDFRYWMDQEGADAMCFWSENHALLFYTCQMIAGKLWPDEYFHRSGLNGKDQYAEGYRRVNEWFDVIEHDGFEEFLAGGYLLVTIAALVVVHLFGDEKLRERAKKTADRIVYEACTQCFDGIHLAPMGRIYRSSLMPYLSGLQALLYLMDGKCAKQSDHWLGFFACADYKIPEDAKELIYKDIETSFNTGRAWVTTKKTKGYMLTSVASPRREPLDEFANKETEYYKTLLMNEWFHGTSNFVPGEYGYQQHLWYAAISNKCYTFVNHPGTERDFGHMRPDYWYGNGVFPAILQEGSTLYTYFDIPDAHPTKFTHVFWPTFAMDDEACDGNFRFARVGTSYMALWCSNDLELNNTDAVMDCDFRAYGDTCAWVVRVGTQEEFGSFINFMTEFKDMKLTKDFVKNKILG